MDCSPPCSSVHGIIQERVLEWVAIPFSRRSSRSRDWTLVSCFAGRFFTIWDTRKALDRQFSSVQSLSRVRLFVTPWTTARQAFLSITNSQSLSLTHVHRVGDAIQPSHPLPYLSPPTFSLSQHQGLFKWVSSSHQVAKGLEFQLQLQSFQWIFRTDFL